MAISTGLCRSGITPWLARIKNSLGVPICAGFCGAGCLTEPPPPRVSAGMPGQPCGHGVLLQCTGSRVEIPVPGKGRPRGGALAVSKEPPPSHVRSDLQASLTSWGFYPTKAIFGSSAHGRSLDVWAYLARSGVSGCARLLPPCQQRSKATWSGANVVGRLGMATPTLRPPCVSGGGFRRTSGGSPSRCGWREWPRPRRGP